MVILLSIALGGAIGAVSRFGLSHFITAIIGHGFPYSTMVVNILGSLIMGLSIGIFAHYYTPTPEVKAFFVTGVFGAFTTFSTFSLDAVTLIERQNYLEAGAYILFSVLLSISALFIGLYLIRVIN